MSNIIAKFKCDNVEDHPDCQQKTIALSAVTSGSEENKSFSKYTPSGLLYLSVSYETTAVDFFVPGEEYYLNISKTVD